MSRPEPLQKLLYQYLKVAGLQEKFESYLPFLFWDQTVGPRISEKTEPYKVVNGSLFVKVPDSVWRNELQYMKVEIIEKLNQKIGKSVIRDIKFY
ncbi:MAG: DUF721 domain-containing protein [Calditrichia bacterium]